MTAPASPPMMPDGAVAARAKGEAARFVWTPDSPTSSPIPILQRLVRSSQANLSFHFCCDFYLHFILIKIKTTR
jgi:hypothetical protein